MNVSNRFPGDIRSQDIRSGDHQNGEPQNGVDGPRADDDGLLPDEPRMIQAVQAYLAAVESGNVEAGFVYKTDALISKKIKVAVEIPTADSPNISYPIAILKSTAHPAAAEKLEENPAAHAARPVVLEVAIHNDN